MIYLFLLAHLVADFMLQPYWLVVRKQRWSGLLIHGAIVLVCMLALPLIDPATHSLWPAMLAITAIHILTDRLKVHYADHVLRPPIVPFCLDQVIHGTTIAIALNLSLPSAHVWTLAGSPVALFAVYASVYITAACAVPIAVMIWLDPTFQHLALAGGARIRGSIIAAVVVSLTLIGGLIALPATLLGFVVVARHPVSHHPLDTPVGLFTVLSIAAMLATALIMLRG